VTGGTAAAPRSGPLRITPRGWLLALGLGGMAALYALGPGTGQWCRALVTNSRSMILNRHLDREQRTEGALGEPYRLVRLARDMTPQDARILIPSGLEHSPLSSRTWCLYYLYPRHLLQIEEIRGPVAGQADYILVHRRWGIELSGQPRDSLRAMINGVLHVRAPGPAR
jgi:hypothetical protein